MIIRIYWLLLFISLAPIMNAQSQTKTLLFIGTYTNEVPANGIFIYEFDEEDGSLKKLGQGDQIINPSYLSISPNGKYLYACTETRKPFEGSISSFKIDSFKGEIKLINQKASGGANPVYLDIHHSGKYLVNANYTGGSVSLFDMNEDGSLNDSKYIFQFKDSSINRSRQESSHIHSSNFSPDYKFVYLPDLGADKIRVFEFHPDSSRQFFENKLLEIKAELGSGPRHFTFHPSGKFAYCIEELSGTVCVYSCENGKLIEKQKVKSYSKTQDSYGSADIHISPDGLFLYASNRWIDENTIAVFSISKNGSIKLLQHQKTGGDHPRNFTLDPSGNFILVANKNSNNVIVFKRNKTSGLLKQTDVQINIPNPSCLKMRTYTFK